MNNQEHGRYYRRGVRRIPRDREGLEWAQKFKALALCWATILVALIMVVLFIVQIAVV